MKLWERDSRKKFRILNYKIPNKLTSSEESICEIYAAELKKEQKNNTIKPTENTWRIWCGNIQRRNPENPCHKMLRKRDACHIWHTSRFSVTSMSISRRFRSSFHTISSKYSRPTLITHVFRPVIYSAYNFTSSVTTSTLLSIPSTVICS